WMKGNVAGINFKTAPGQLYCCDVINGRRYFSTSVQDATQREAKRTWPGIAISLNFFAHEIRHADAGAPGHTNGCPAFPLPTDPRGVTHRIVSQTWVGMESNIGWNRNGRPVIWTSD